ncbi:hypothetical protein D3C84_1045850 [compost metagenome]
MAIISPYNARCIRCETPVCQTGSVGVIGGRGVSRPSKRTHTNTKMLSPNKPCNPRNKLFKACPFGNSPLISMQAYTPTNSASISQCKVIESFPYW